MRKKQYFNHKLQITSVNDYKKSQAIITCSIFHQILGGLTRVALFSSFENMSK